MQRALATAEGHWAASAERLRLAHRASPGTVPHCLSCSQQWPCPTRMCLDEVSSAARVRYAMQVHRAWLAGIPTPQDARADGARF
jgi:hypothetical protein